MLVGNRDGHPEDLGIIGNKTYLKGTVHECLLCNPQAQYRNQWQTLLNIEFHKSGESDQLRNCKIEAFHLLRCYVA
jgi:hypothetical protein